MRIKLDPQKQPVKSKVRRYAVPQRKFLNKYMDKLVEYGFVVRNPHASWQAAPHLVPKSSKAEFRTTIDLRPVNAATISQSWPMPNIESELQDFSGSNFFATLDFCSGYWQLPLHPESYDACGIVCPQGSFFSTRVLPGLKNATAYFQSTIEPLFSEMRDNIKAWLDDFTLHSKYEMSLLTYLSTFFAICKKTNLYLSARKCIFFSKSIKWCGRIVDSTRFILDPRNAESLRNMHLPISADELCQFVHCCRWMSGAIPDFNRQTATLVEILERAYEKAGSRKKRSIKHMPLSSLSWGAKHEASFKYIQDTLQNSIRLAYPKQGKTICIYTDASDRFWSGVVTQVRPEELGKETEQQSHDPLAFIGSEFKGSELNWSTYEKEGFAIFKVFERLDYLMMGDQPVHVFTDHRNLLYVFSPVSFEAATGRHVISKVQRWAMFLSRFEFVIEHIDGQKNVFADILTRWARGYRVDELRTSRICALTSVHEKVTPKAADITWPSLQNITEAQHCGENIPPLATRDRNGLVTLDGKIWLPNQALEIKLKILVLSHCGEIGHRGATATESILRESFIWDGISKDVSEFVGGCLNCLMTRSGEIIPRPLANALHGSRANEVVHMDYLYLGPAAGSDMKYALIIRDDLSSFVWLWPTCFATGEAAADALGSWMSSFGAMEWLVTDQGSHFVNSLLKELTDGLSVNHHFTTAYCPWANGTIERVCREVIRGCQALIHEMKLARTDWPAVLEAVQSVLNHAPLKRLGLRNKNDPGIFRTPLEVFTGHLPSRPLIRALPLQNHGTADSIESLRARQLIDIKETQSALDEMHRDVDRHVSQSRQGARDRHNKRTRVQPVNFSVGDFVLVRTASRKAHKLSYRWIGPRRVADALREFVYSVENLVTGGRETVHSRRIIFYRSDMDGKEMNEDLIESAKLSESSYQVVDKITDIRRGESGVEVRITWNGLPDSVDQTWESAESLRQDIPGMLEDFLHTPGKRVIKKWTLNTYFK